MRRRGTLPVGGAIGFDDPTGLTRECGEYVVHVRTRRQGEVPVLAETGEHAARDGAAVTLAELGALLLLLPLFLPLPGGIGRRSRRGSETAGAAGLRLRVRMG